MNEDIIKQLEELGLSNKEARVYLANLSLGPAGVQQIADTSGIKRVTTYVILEALAGLGLVSQTNQTKKTLFNAESPENLRRLLEKREQSLKDQKQNLEDLLPHLNSFKSHTADAPTIRLFEGVEGIRTIHKLFFEELKTKGTGVAYGISNLDDVHEFFPDIFQNKGNNDRIDAGVKSRFLYTSSEGAIYKATDKERNRESRFIPKDKYPIAGDISIKGNKVIILNLTGDHPSGVVIDSAEYTKTMLSLFELTWNAVAEYN